MKIILQHVYYMPEKLESGILYVSKEFGCAQHLCGCGCGTKIHTPLGVGNWTLTETEAGPSLSPSIGNWQLACKSHYFITRGEVVFA